MTSGSDNVLMETDLLATIPRDVLEYIGTHHFNLECVSLISQTSRWLANVFNKPEFWKILDFGSFAKPGPNAVASAQRRLQRFSKTTHVSFAAGANVDIATVFGIVRVCPQIQSVTGAPPAQKSSVHETVFMRQLLTGANNLLTGIVALPDCTWDSTASFDDNEFRNDAVRRLRLARAMLSDALYLGIANNWGRYDDKKFAESLPDQVLTGRIYEMYTSTDKLMPLAPPIGNPQTLQLPHLGAFHSCMEVIYTKFVAIATGGETNSFMIVDFKEMRVMKVVNIAQLLVAKFGTINKKYNKLGQVLSMKFLNGYLFAMTNRLHVLLKVDEDLSITLVNSGLDWSNIPYFGSHGTLVPDSSNPSACPLVILGPDIRQIHIVDPVVVPQCSMPVSKRASSQYELEDEEALESSKYSSTWRPTLPIGAKWLEFEGESLEATQPVPVVSGDGKAVVTLNKKTLYLRSLKVARKGSDQTIASQLRLQDSIVFNNVDSMHLLAVCYDGSVAACYARPEPNKGVLFVLLSSKKSLFVLLEQEPEYVQSVQFLARDGSLAAIRFNNAVVLVHVCATEAKIIYTWRAPTYGFVPAALLDHFDGNIADLKIDLLVSSSSLLRVFSLPGDALSTQKEELAKLDAPVSIREMICHNGIIYAGGPLNVMGTATPSRTMMLTINGLNTTVDMTKSSISFNKIGTIESIQVHQVKMDGNRTVVLGLSNTALEDIEVAVIDPSSKEKIWSYSMSRQLNWRQGVYCPDCTFWKDDVVLVVDRKYGMYMANWKTNQYLGVFGSIHFYNCHPHPEYRFLFGGMSGPKYPASHSAFVNEKGEVVQTNPPSRYAPSSLTCDWSPDGTLCATGHAVPVMKRTGKTENDHYFEKLINLERGMKAKGIQTVRGQESVLYVRFSPNGEWLGVLDGPSRPGWGLSCANVLLRIYCVKDLTLRLTYDVGPLATSFCWYDQASVLLIGDVNGGITSVPSAPIQVRTCL